jgi:hypothetical protein
MAHSLTETMNNKEHILFIIQTKSATFSLLAMLFIKEEWTDIFLY